MWMRQPAERRQRRRAAGRRPAIAGGSPEADLDPGARAASDRIAGGADGGPRRHWAQPETVLVGVAAAVATIFFGIWPSPLFDFATHAAAALSGLL